MIIGLAGEKESGKDTVGAYLVKRYGFERRAFADPLKKSVAVLLDIPFHEVDKFKGDATIHVSLGYTNKPNLEDSEGNTWQPGIDFPEEIVPSEMWSPIITPMTFRQFLQRYGTESHRDVFGEDFWVDQTLPATAFYVGRNIVVTDCRFENEAARIRTLRGKIVRISGRGPLPANKDPHSSEQFNFKADHVIENNGSLAELYENIEEMLLSITSEAYI